MFQSCAHWVSQTWELCHEGPPHPSVVHLGVPEWALGGSLTSGLGEDGISVCQQQHLAGV